MTITAHAISGEALLSNAASRPRCRRRPDEARRHRDVRSAGRGGAGSRHRRERARPPARHRGIELRRAGLHDAGPHAVGADASYRGRTAREIQDLRAAPDAPPTTSRQFSRTERLLLRFDAYGPAGTAPTIAMRLLNRMGDGDG